MKKFQFSLSTLLNVRRLKEEIAQKNLLESQILLQKEMTTLEEFLQAYYGTKNEIRKIQKSMSHPEEFTRLYEYLADMKKRIKAQQILVETAKMNVELKRQDVIRAMQQRKIIENLREKKFSEWENEFFDLERKAFDELATMQYGRKKSKS